MIEWNYRIIKILIHVTENKNYVMENFINCIYQFKKHNNLFLLICLALLLVGIYIWNKFYRKEGAVFTNLQVINLLSHIVLTCIIGYCIEIADVDEINKLLSIYWSIGIIIFCFVAILLMKEIILFRQSFPKIIRSFSKLYYILGITYIFAAISTNQLVIVNDIFLILIFVLGWVLLHHFSWESDNYRIDMVDEESDVEIISYNQLLPTRQQEYKRILALIEKNNYNEPFALLLNGDWGEGKTSLINVLSKQLLDDYNYIIFIQPMILDTTEKLMEYFFGQLEKILNSNGVYTGKDSPFKRYINLVLQTINTINLKEIIKLDGFLNGLDENQVFDFRSNKQSLEKDIQKLLNYKRNTNDSRKSISNRKIFIIIDDFDRVEEDTFKNILTFIKELVNFKGINVIFLMDEKRIEMHNKINREYLDKFVNRKFQLSKLEYKEIFNYFKKNLEREKFESEWATKVGNDIKGNLVIYINELIFEFERDYEKIQKRLKELSENSEIDRKDIQKTLFDEKDEFELVFSKLKDGITNTRKVKKIIREIKEILFYCDQSCSVSLNFSRNLNKISRVEELIVRIAIYKILFGEHVDKFMQKNDRDFYSVMDSIKFLQHTDNIFSSFFLKFINIGFNEETGLKMDILNDFCNALILNRPFDKLFEDKKTVSESILKNLDDQAIKLEVASMEEIKEYLRIIMINNYSVTSNIANRRRKKIISHIITLYETRVLTLKNLFDLLRDSQRNPLLDNEIYLKKLKKIICQGAIFQTSSDKTFSLNCLEGTSMPIFLNYKNDIIVIMRLLKLDDISYRSESFSIDLDDITSLKEINKAIIRIFKIKSSPEPDLSFLKQWLKGSLETIIRIYDENKYIKDLVKYYNQRIEKFIEIYDIKEELQKKLIDTKVESSYRFIEKPVINSTKELTKFVEEFYEFMTQNKFNFQYIDYFRTLLFHLEITTRKDKCDSMIISKIEKIYDLIPVGNYDENSEEKAAWISCTLKLGEIQENLKKINR